MNRVEEKVRKYLYEKENRDDVEDMVDQVSIAVEEVFQYYKIYDSKSRKEIMKKATPLIISGKVKI